MAIRFAVANSWRIFGLVRQSGERLRQIEKGPNEMTAKMTPAARKARNARTMAQLTFAAGLLLSLAANVVVSRHSPVGIVTAIWSPVALLLALGMLENGSIKGRAAQIAVGTLAAVAAWASYWHLVEFFTNGGADVITAHALPLTVDVLMGLASTALKAKAAPVRRARKTASKAAPVRKLRAA